jgi:hypothetical protein
MLKSNADATRMGAVLSIAGGHGVDETVKLVDWIYW